MLNEHGADYVYREYTEEPLKLAELKKLFGQLEETPRKLLRKGDKAAKALGLTGKETDAALMKLMAKHPTLLQRPIGVRDDRAIVGRPIENLLELVD